MVKYFCKVKKSIGSIERERDFLKNERKIKMADEATTEEVTMVQVEVAGRIITLPSDSKVLVLIEKADEEQKAEKFKANRELVADAILQVAIQQIDGYEEAINGMCVIVRFGADIEGKPNEDGSHSVQIVEYPKVKVVKRMPKES